ncbi:MAG: DUF2283 domain-containing protein [Candidatus Aenigmatarchaeota archaeon]
MKRKVDYDRENDILYVNEGKKVQDSLQIDNFVIDFSHKNNIVGLEVMNASESIPDLADQEIKKSDLEQLVDAKLSVKQGRDAIYVKLMILFKKNKKEHLSLPIPSKVSAA